MSTEKSRDNSRSTDIYLTDLNATSAAVENGRSNEYNPYDHRVVEHPNTALGSLTHIIKCSLGAGLLAIPLAFKNAGLLVGALGTLLVGLVCTHCCKILVNTQYQACKRAKVPSLSFAETAEKVFETGPPALRRYAYFAKAFCEYGLTATYLGVDCVLIVHIATSFAKVISHEFNVDWDIRFYIAMALVPCLILAEIRQLKYLVPFSAIANLFLGIVFCITAYYIFTGPMEIEKRPLFTSWTDLPLFFSTVIYAIEGIGAILPVENTMEKPQQFTWVLNTAMVVVVVLYVSLGFLGYVRYGDDIKPSITLNLPQNGFIDELAQLLISFVILCSFGLQFFVPMDILWRKIAVRIPKERHNLAQYLFRAGVVLILGATAAAVPKLDAFMGLVGAVFFTSLGLLVPAVLETVVKYPDELGFGKWILIKNVTMALFSLMAITSGAYVSILDIIELYS